jgi:hypothetical protein
MLAQATTVRKNWLRSFYVYLIYFVVVVIISVINNFSPDDTTQAIAPLTFFGLMALEGLLLLWGPYYFAYKNRGTKFLLLTFADLVSNVRICVEQLFANDWSNNINANQLFFLISLGIMWYYATTCYQLYELNSALKKAKE